MFVGFCIFNTATQKNVQMGKKKFYVLGQQYYIHYLVEYVEDKAKEIVSKSIREILKKRKFIIDKNEYCNLIKIEINELSKIVNTKEFNLGNEVFLYKYDFEQNILKINSESLIMLMMDKSDANIEFDYFFTVLEHYDTHYGLDDYELIKIEEEEMYVIFDEYHYNLINEISNFIILEYWINEIKKLEQVTTPIIIENNQSIDLSNTKGTEKIIMLYKMGVFDFLRKQEPFNASTNTLASAISGITGIDAKTVQSYINPIDNPTAEQKNNPLTSTKTVNKVIQKLSDIGYIPIK